MSRIYLLASNMQRDLAIRLRGLLEEDGHGVRLSQAGQDFPREMGEADFIVVIPPHEVVENDLVSIGKGIYSTLMLLFEPHRRGQQNKLYCGFASRDLYFRRIRGINEAAPESDWKSAYGELLLDQKKLSRLPEDNGIAYGIGIEDEKDGVGMVDGPSKSLPAMYGRSGQKGAVLFRLTGTENIPLFRWDEKEHEWVSCY